MQNGQLAIYTLVLLLFCALFRLVENKAWYDGVARNLNDPNVESNYYFYEGQRYDIIKRVPETIEYCVDVGCTKKILIPKLSCSIDGKVFCEGDAGWCRMYAGRIYNQITTKGEGIKCKPIYKK